MKIKNLVNVTVFTVFAVLVFISVNLQFLFLLVYIKLGTVHTELIWHI